MSSNAEQKKPKVSGQGGLHYAWTAKSKGQKDSGVLAAFALLGAGPTAKAGVNNWALMP